ncbi:GumC family protein [Veillonella magna]|uniref:GumC family protein n=1 Tax=Veillonella magna TaxID=464322 RepID=UPI0003F95E26|nr:GumC family protein [Veillonella magna]
MAEDTRKDIPKEEETIDLVELWHTIREHTSFIVKTTAVCILLAGLYLAIATPTYQSVALLRVKQSQGLGDSMLSSLASGNPLQSKQQMSTDAEILKSRQVVIPVIEATQEPNDEGKYPEYEGFVKKHITTTPFKDTDIMQVAMTADTAEGAQEANKLLVNGFLKRLTELSQNEKKVIRQFLEKRVVSSKKELQAAEDKLQAYQSDNKIFSPTDQMKGLTDKISMLDKAKAENQLNLETAKAALASADGQLSSAGISIADSPTIQKYKTQLAELEAEKAGYVGKYTDEHPKMQALNKQIQEVTSSLNTEIDKVVSQEAPSSNPVQQGLLASKFKNEAQIAVAQSKSGALAQLDAEADKMMEQFPEQQKGYIQLKRDQDVAQEIYVMLSKRLEEAKVAEIMVPTEVQVIDEPTLPEKPIAPRKVLTLAIAFILGLLGSSAFVIARSLLNRKVRTADDVEKYLGLPVLGVIPKFEDQMEEGPGHSKQSWWDKLKGGLSWRKRN